MVADRLEHGGHDYRENLRRASALSELAEVEQIGAVIGGNGPIVVFARAVDSLCSETKLESFGILTNISTDTK